MKTPPPYDHVFFDCDSTLSAIEGIEELSGPVRDEIVALTARAMNGELPLEQVYGARLERIRPSLEQLESVGERYVEEALPHAADLVAALKSLGKRVSVISGGLLLPVRHLAEELGVESENVHAVDTRHDESGAYVDFDRASPLARAGGKAELIRELIAGERANATGTGTSESAAGASTGSPASKESDDPTAANRTSEASRAPRIALVGDGATDLEAAELCARFVAFGGVERREIVFAGADATCEYTDLAALLPLLCTADEIDLLRRDPAFHSLIAMATRLVGV